MSSVRGSFKKLPLPKFAVAPVVNSASRRLRFLSIRSKILLLPAIALAGLLGYFLYSALVLRANTETLDGFAGRTLPVMTLAAQANAGSQYHLAHILVALPEGATGDGLTIDSEGRLYVTTPGAMGTGVHVISREGKYLGRIPTPRGVITAAFSGPDKKTLYAVANDRTTPQIYTIPMIAQGYQGRAK